MIDNCLKISIYIENEVLFHIVFYVALAISFMAHFILNVKHLNKSISLKSCLKKIISLIQGLKGKDYPVL